MKLYGVTGWKNTGKTGLMERLVAEFSARGLMVSTIKHTHHDVDLDQPGRDTFRHRTAGAQEVVLSSANRFAILHELRDAAEPPLPDLMTRMAPVDLVLAEGFKSQPHPKIETHRAAAGHDLIAPNDASIRAVASDIALELECPVLDLDDTAAIADFIAQDLNL